MIPVIYPINKRYNSTSLLSSGTAFLKPYVCRLLPVLMALAFSSGASAVGLGELHGQPFLGDPLRLSIDIVGAEKPLPDASCFRIVSPRRPGDIPWLRQGRLSVRQGSAPAVLLESSQPLRDPLLVVAIELGCGNEIHREYTLLASPRTERIAEAPVAAVPAAKVVPATVPSVRETAERKQIRPPAPKRNASADAAVTDKPTKSAAKKAAAVPELPPAFAPVGDRLVLNAMNVGDPSLSLSSDLSRVPQDDAASESRRELLRLEYSMLQSLYEQAISQLAAAEKLRSMESGLSQLQSATVGLAERAQTAIPAGSEASVQSPAPAAVSPVVASPVPVQPAPAPEGVGEDGFLDSEWALYGALGGALLALLVLLVLRRRRQQAEDLEGGDALLAEVPLSSSEAGGVAAVPSVPDESPVPDSPLPVSEAAFVQQPSLGAPYAHPLAPGESVLSQAATTVDEQFEANPVIELADIMLSFGRVKGAAQALQDYIDNNPQEALQPWIRLLDVYRMAGMKDEFENVSKNLNQNFNVEVQKWDVKPYQSSALDLVLDEAVGGASDNKPQGLEDMPHIMQAIVDMWRSPDVVNYMYQLLHDNRGGQRSGFSLGVVEEILFLVEIKEVANRLDKEGGKS